MSLLGLILALFSMAAQLEATYPIEAAIIKTFPLSAWEEARCIQWEEAKANPGAIGDNGLAIGLFQIRVDAHPEYDPERLLEIGYNVQAAYEIWKASGQTFQKDWIRASWLCGR